MLAAQAEKIRTHCRCCPALCGIVVEVADGKVVRVAGDPENRRSGGYICPKGASLPYFHHNPNNLLRPELRGQPTDWTTCLDDLAARMRALIDAYGPDSIAVYHGTGAYLDNLGFMTMKRFMAEIGTQQIYSPTTVDIAPAHRASELVCGTFEIYPVWVPEDEESRLVLYLGTNPLISHGYLTVLPNPVNRIRAFKQRGGKVWTVDPKRTKTTVLGECHLAIRPGADAFLLAWLIRELIDDGADTEDFERTTTARDRTKLRDALQPFTRDFASDRTGLPVQALEALLADIRAAGRMSVVAGTGILFGPHALLTEWLRWVLLIVTGSLDRKGGMWFDPRWLNPLDQRAKWTLAPPEGRVEPGPKSRPDLPRLLGQNPCVALPDEIEAGNVKALFVVGASPLTAFPNPDRTEAALRLLDTLVSVDILETQVTRIASHALPAAGQLERLDIVSETCTMVSPAVVKPQGDRRDAWWIFAELGRRLGMDLLGGIDARATTSEILQRRFAECGRDGADALFAAGPEGLASPRLYGWVREKVLENGQWRLIPPGLLERLEALPSEARQTAHLVLLNARQLTRNNGTGYVSAAKSRDYPLLHLHPQNAKELGIADNDKVRVESGAGYLDAEARLDSDLPPGAVSMSHGWYGTNVCRLTSEARDIDPMTTQPQMNAIPVTVVSKIRTSR